MAITFFTELTTRATASLLASNADLVYTVTSNSSSNDNYQYVMDINDENDNLIARFKQRPNPSGIGVFNVNGFMRNKCASNPPSDTRDIGVKAYNVSSDRVKAYKLRMGEEWSTTPTSSITLYNGIDDTAAAPAATASNLVVDDQNYFAPFVSNRHELDEVEVDVQQFYSGSTTFRTRWLTDMPLTDIPIRKDDTMWFGFLWGAPDKDSQGDVAHDLYNVQVQGIDSTGADVGGAFSANYTDAATEGGDAPRTAALLSYTSVDANAFNDKYPVRHSLALLQNYAASFNASATGFRTFIIGYEAGPISLNGGEATFKFQDDNCPWPIYRLAWLNKYGAWDFFNFNGVHSENTTRQDSTYKQSFIDYGATAAGQNMLDTQRRGLKNFNTAVETNVTVRTDFLTQEWADWLEGLFVSPSVYLIEGTGSDAYWIPIQLTTADYRKNTNTRTQKIKSYNVSFRYANRRTPVANG